MQGETYRTLATGPRAALKRAGLSGRGLVWHSLRHTYASRLANRGVSLYVISNLLGHRSLQMSARYSHLSPDARRQAVDLLDPRGTDMAHSPTETKQSR